MSYHISPQYMYDDFKYPLSIDDAITVFEDRVSGWQLGIAQELARREVPDRGYAQLHIVMSYFEMICQFIEGCSSKGKEGDFFCRGVRQVFPELSSWPIANDFMDDLYAGIRCGLYHEARTRENVILTGDSDATVRYQGLSNGQWRVVVNPDRLVDRLIADFARFIGRLRDPSEVSLRERFYGLFQEWEQ